MRKIKHKDDGDDCMKVFERKYNEVGKAVDNGDEIIFSLISENRVFVIPKKDIMVEEKHVEQEITKEDAISKRGEIVARLGHGVIYKNVLDEFRHAKSRTEMMDIMNKFYPGNIQDSLRVMVNLYMRAIRLGVVSVPSHVVVLKPNTVNKKKRLSELKYLPVKEDSKLGKSLSDSLSLNVYKRYSVRLWNNVMADVMSRVNSAKEDEVNSLWFENTLKGVYSQYALNFNQHQYNAVLMWLKGSGLVSSRRGLDKKMIYHINKRPEIPRTIST